MAGGASKDGVDRGAGEAMVADKGGGAEGVADKGGKAGFFGGGAGKTGVAGGAGKAVVDNEGSKAEGSAGVGVEAGDVSGGAGEAIEVTGGAGKAGEVLMSKTACGCHGEGCDGGGGLRGPARRDGYGVEVLGVQRPAVAARKAVTGGVSGARPEDAEATMPWRFWCAR